MSAALLILLLAAAPVPGDPADNPPDPIIEDRLDVLAPGRQGQIQCYQPNPFKKTCKGMVAYSFDGDRIIGRAQFLMDETGPAVVVATSPVEVKDGAVCGRLDNLPNARFTIAGQPATPSQDAGYRLVLAVAPRSGEVCIRWSGAGNGGYWATGTLDGRERKDFEQWVMWVEPSEGFVVAP